MPGASIGPVRQAVLDGAYRFAGQAEREREADCITIREIEEAFESETLELIEEYPGGHKGPSALFLGLTSEGRPLHVGVTSNPDNMAVITIYRPDAHLWYDWRRRA